MSQLFFLLILLACPLMMMLMMRGMHGGHADHGGDHTPTVVDTTARDARIADLEREVASLRARITAPQDDRHPVGR